MFVSAATSSSGREREIERDRERRRKQIAADRAKQVLIWDLKLCFESCSKVWTVWSKLLVKYGNVCHSFAGTDQWSAVAIRTSPYTHRLCWAVHHGAALADSTHRPRVPALFRRLNIRQEGGLPRPSALLAIVVWLWHLPVPWSVSAHGGQPSCDYESFTTPEVSTLV